MTTREYACLLNALALLALGCKGSPSVARSSDSSADTSGSQHPHLLTALPGAFAYVDSTGTELLALGSLDDPATILGAVCSEARVLPVRYERTQERRQDDNGRQVAYNFGNEAGNIFRVVRGTARPNETCYLSADSALLAGAVSVRPLDLSACSSEHSARLAAAKRRHVVRCWRVAQIPPDAELLAVQFATVDSAALASLALVGDTAIRFHDFPGAYRGPDDDVWRVDDRGVFSPEDFGIVFVVPWPHAYAMAITWAGAEGESDHFLIADSADVFRVIVKDYRYWAP